MAHPRMAMIDRDNVWATIDGYSLIYSTDGGQSWEIQPEVSGSGNLGDIFFLDAMHGWVAQREWVDVSSGQWRHHVFKTTDGGLNWDRHEFPFEASETFWWHDYLTLHFINSSVGLAAVGSAIVRSEDGGLSWQDIAMPAVERLTDVTCQDESLCWAVGEEGSILSSEDGGLSWMVQAIFPGYRLAGIDFLDPRQGYIVGWKSDADDYRDRYLPVMLATLDGGSNWFEETIHAAGALLDTSVADGSFWASGWVGLVVRGPVEGNASSYDDSICAVETMDYGDGDAGAGHDAGDGAGDEEAGDRAEGQPSGECSCRGFPR